MSFELLRPVSDKVVAHSALAPLQSIGRSIELHTAKKGLPELEGLQLAILGVPEARNAVQQRHEPLDLDQWRLSFYSLMVGNWSLNIADLGDVPSGATAQDTYVLLKEITAELLEHHITPIVIGASQDLTYALYRAFDTVLPQVNLVGIDARFDFGNAHELISSQTYMSRILTEEPHRLAHYTNLGYQSFLNTQEENDLMERMFFDAYRLGRLTQDLTMAEPVLREAHLCSIDARVVEAAYMGQGPAFMPNGLNGREICALARYAGLADDLRLFGLFELDNHLQSLQLGAQIAWYFLEGFSLRRPEIPQADHPDFVKYTVALDHEEIVFMKSLVTDRWWIISSDVIPLNNKKSDFAFISCSKEDYDMTCLNELPMRLISSKKRGYN
jgi:arginase family enzyme